MAQGRQLTVSFGGPTACTAASADQRASAGGHETYACRRVGPAWSRPDEIATALADQTDYEHHWLINSQTGEIVFWTRDAGIDGQHPVDLDDLEPELFVTPLPSYVWYEDMVDFAEQLSNDRAARRLARAIQGRGAFRRFKDELHEEHPELLPTWYAFRDVRAKRRAVEWLFDNSLIDQDTADGYLTDHPDPQLP
jgi:hypothetical protein